MSTPAVAKIEHHHIGGVLEIDIVYEGGRRISHSNPHYVVGELRLARYDLQQPTTFQMYLGLADALPTNVHTSHCCEDHGCKYMDEDCPVATGVMLQQYPCELCSEEPY